VRQINSYVIRIYRRDAQALAGVVEDVQRGRSASFQSTVELGELLSGRKAFPRRPARPVDADPATTSPSNPSEQP
jgi:hypothetical protein